MRGLARRVLIFRPHDVAAPLGDDELEDLLDGPFSDCDVDHDCAVLVRLDATRIRVLDPESSQTFTRARHKASLRDSRGYSLPPAGRSEPHLAAGGGSAGGQASSWIESTPGEDQP